MSDTRTPLTDAVYKVVYDKDGKRYAWTNPQGADGLNHAIKLERKAAHFDALRSALRGTCVWLEGWAESGSATDALQTARKALAAADEIGGD